MTIKTQTLALINGNGQQYHIGLPKLVILSDHKWNDVALQHIFDNTGLNFQGDRNMEARPCSTDQIVKLLLTYNFKTQYWNNNTHKNTLFLKVCRDEGFKTDTICYECVKKNNLFIGGLKPGDFLAV